MKYILLFIGAFSIGFFVHAIFFPDLFVNALGNASQLPNLNQTTSPKAVKNPVQNITTIEFNGTSFTPHKVTMEASRYLVVINTNKDTLMWLSSTNPDLATNRGYGYLEQVKTRIDEKGEVIIADTNNPKERVVITVK